MNEGGAPVAIGPEAYAAWRATSLGAITEAIEQRLILSMMGELRGARVLDAGWRDGALVCAAVSRGAVATGVDPDPAMLTAARSRADQAGIDATFLEARLELLPFADAEFDVVVAVTVLCFMPEKAGTVREMARVLRPGGTLVLGELGRWSLWVSSGRVRGWFGSYTWEAARFRTGAKLRVLTEQAGLGAIAVRGAVFYPPLTLLARAIAPFDPWLGRMTTYGAAFIAVRAIKVDAHGSA